MREVEIWYGSLAVWRAPCACKQGGLYRRNAPFRTAIKSIAEEGVDGRQPKGPQQTGAGKPRKRRLNNYDAPHASESSLDRLFCPTRVGYSFSSAGKKGTRGGATTAKDRDGECCDNRQSLGPPKNRAVLLPRQQGLREGNPRSLHDPGGCA